MINDVEIKQLITHTDERGFFREIVRSTEELFSAGFGQWSHSLMYQNVIKAWHWHQKQTDWWYVVSGVIRVGLCDMRKSSSTKMQTMDFLMGDNQSAQLIKIPPGVAHGCKAVQGPANLLYVTSEIYNPNDELRIAYNDPKINFDWLRGPEIT
ncbi:dTDP-4-dehydrorhamnose 3,5-epimerase family protein [Planctomycetota bacterium]